MNALASIVGTSVSEMQDDLLAQIQSMLDAGKHASFWVVTHWHERMLVFLKLVHRLLEPCIFVGLLAWLRATGAVMSMCVRTQGHTA